MNVPASHQTVELTSGRHAGPDQGVCVMELASMLAGERFSDCPASVCRVIAAFLRRYNDVIDHERRQQLYGVAAKVVGTSAAGRVRRRRIRHLRRRLRELTDERRVAVHMGYGSLLAAACADELARRGDHQAALDLVDELIAIGGEVPHDPEPLPAAPAGQRLPERTCP